MQTTDLEPTEVTSAQPEAAKKPRRRRSAKQASPRFTEFLREQIASTPSNDNVKQFCKAFNRCATSLHSLGMLAEDGEQPESPPLISNDTVHRWRRGQIQLPWSQRRVLSYMSGRTFEEIGFSVKDELLHPSEEIGELDYANAIAKRLTKKPLPLTHYSWSDFRFLRGAMADEDNLQGQHARYLLPLTRTCIRQMRAFLDGLSGESRLAMQRELAAYLSLASWLSLDAGELAVGKRLNQDAFHLAIATHDQGVQGQTLCRRAYMGLYEEDMAAVVLHAAAAREHCDVARVHAYASTLEARGYVLRSSRMNDHRLLSALEAAEKLRERFPQEESHNYSPCSSCTPFCIAVVDATCRMYVRPEEGIARYEAILRTIPSTYARDLGVYLAQMGRAYVSTKLKGGFQPEQAAHWGLRSLAIAMQSFSMCNLKELVRLGRCLEPFAEQPDVAHFHEAFMEFVHTLTTEHGREALSSLW